MLESAKEIVPENIAWMITYQLILAFYVRFSNISILLVVTVFPYTYIQYIYIVNTVA